MEPVGGARRWAEVSTEPATSRAATGERSAILLAAALVPATFLAVDPAGWYPFGPARWWVASTLALGVPAALAAAGRPLRVERSVAAWWAALLAVLAVAAARGVDPRYAWIGTPERRLGWCGWLVFAAALVAGRSLPVRRSAPAVRGALVVAGLGVGGAAVLQALGVRPGPLGLGGDRLGATFGTPALLGSAAALLLPALAGLAAGRAGSRPLRLAAGVAAAAVAVALLGSGTRGAWAGSLAALVALLVLRRRSGTRPRWAAGGDGDPCRTGGAGGVGDAGGAGGGARPSADGAARPWSGRAADHPVALGVAAAGAVVLLALVTPVGGRLADLADGGGAGGRARVDEWRVATRVLARHPVLGVGPEGYRIAFAEGVDDRYERDHGRDPLPDRAHSAPLDVALAGGLPALAAWVGLLVAVGRRLVPVLRRGPPEDAGLAVGVVAAVASSLVLFPTTEVDVALWFLAGVTLARAARSGRAPRGGHASSVGHAPDAEAVASQPARAVREVGGPASPVGGAAREGEGDASAVEGIVSSGADLASAGTDVVSPGADRRPDTAGAVPDAVPGADRRAGGGVGGDRVLVARHGAVGAVAGVLAAVALVTGAAGVAADRDARAAVEALDRGEVAAALARARSAAARRPDVLRHHLLLARVRAAAGEGHRRALADLARADAWSPDDPVLRLARARERLPPPPAPPPPPRPPACPATWRPPGPRRPRSWTTTRCSRRAGCSPATSPPSTVGHPRRCGPTSGPSAWRPGRWRRRCAWPSCTCAGASPTRPPRPPGVPCSPTRRTATPGASSRWPSDDGTPRPGSA